MPSTRTQIKMKEIPPIPAPEVGEKFLNGRMECPVTSVWKSRFGDWKVSFKDSAKGGGIINLEYFNERFKILPHNAEVSHRDRERQPAADQPTNQP
jgi:hypothetical protein